MSAPRDTRALLEKVRKQREARGLSAPAPYNGGNVNNDGNDYTSRRREAREKMRAARQRRGGSNDNDENNNMNSSSIKRRSLTKGLSGSNLKNNNINEDNFNSDSILQLDQADYLYDLTVGKFTNAEDEAKRQPLMTVSESFLGTIWNKINPLSSLFTLASWNNNNDNNYDNNKFRSDREYYDKSRRNIRHSMMNMSNSNDNEESIRLLNNSSNFGQSENGLDMVLLSPLTGAMLSYETSRLNSYGTNDSDRNNTLLSLISQRINRDIIETNKELKQREEIYGNNSNSSSSSNSSRVINQSLRGSLAFDTSALGNIISISEDPVYRSPYKMIFDSKEPSLGGLIGNWSVDNEKDSLGDILSSATTSSQDGKSATVKSLIIAVNNLQFTDHPFLIQEEKLGIQMQQLYGAYRTIFDQQLIPYLSNRFYQVSKEIKLLLNKGNAEPDDMYALHSLYHDLYFTLTALHEIRSKLDNMSNSLYGCWKDIKSERQKQGFNSTKLKLVACKVKSSSNTTSSSNNDIIWDKFGIDVRESINLFTKGKSVLSSYAENNDNFSTPTNMYDFILTKDTALDAITNCCNELSRGVIPEVFLYLSGEDNYTQTRDLNDEAEKFRRHRLVNSKYLLSFRINGHEYQRSNVGHLNLPEYSIDFNESFVLPATNGTVTVAVLLEDSMKFFNARYRSHRTIAEIVIPKPGSNLESVDQLPAFSLTSSAHRLQFSDTSASREGSILVLAQYAFVNEPTNDVNGFDTTLLTKFQNTKSTSPLFKENIDFARENDFQKILSSESFCDVNDPNNETLISSIRRAASRGVRSSRDIFQLSPNGDLVGAFIEDGSTYLNYTRFQCNNRARLLKIRSFKPYLFSEPIPILDDTIRRSDLYRNLLSFNRQITSTQNDKPKEEGTSITIADGEALDEKERFENAHLSFWRKVQESKTNISRAGSRRFYSTGSLVSEVDLTPQLTWTDILDFSWLIPSPKRALKPATAPRAPQAVNVQKCDVLVQIVGASNLPRRKYMGDAGLDSRAQINAGPSISKELSYTRTIVEVKFQDVTLNTICLTGASPMWKQSLALPFTPPQMELTPAALLQVKDDVVFSIFDEFEEDDSDRGGFLEGESTTRNERRFLGSFSVPFVTIYTEGKIDGVFRIDTPVMNLGYQWDEERSTNLNTPSPRMTSNNDQGILRSIGLPTLGEMAEALGFNDSTVIGVNAPQLDPKTSSDTGAHAVGDRTKDELHSFVSSQTSSFIKVMLTLDPLLIQSSKKTQSSSLPIVANEDVQYASYAVSWLKSLKNYRSYTDTRHYQVFASNSKGEGVLIPRYLCAQKPPMGFNTRRQCIQFVSRVPFMSDAQAFVGELDVWCTMDEIFDLCAGDEEEHGMLLFNYLYYLSLANQGSGHDNVQHVLLVLGRAIPEGSTVYIAMKSYDGPSDDNYLLVNPCTGYVYSCYDRNCPLQEILMVATPDNLWANIQPSTHPSSISFDIKNTYFWRPFFGRKFTAPKSLRSIQPNIVYSPTSPSYALEVERMLDQAIKNSFRRWRSRRQRSRTVFNLEASQSMYSMLEDMDNYMLTSSYKGHHAELAIQMIQDKALERIASSLRSRQIYGVTLNLPYTDVEALVSKVKSLSIHQSDHPDVQFVSSVRVIPYVNSVLSVWIFVGTMEGMSGENIQSLITSPSSPLRRRR